MPTYPLTFPSIGVVSSSFRLVRVVDESVSEFTAARKKYRHQGEWWEGEVTLKPMTYAESATVKAFLAELRGKFGSFLYGDPDALAKGLLGAGGTITVNGGSQIGNSLTVDGMTPSTNNILKPGDYFQLGTGSSACLYMATQALNSDGGGAGTLTFEPSLRSSPADNQAVLTSDPVGVFQLADSNAEWASDFSCVTSITIPFVEVISV